jgi:hypothetical protein
MTDSKFDSDKDSPPPREDDYPQQLPPSKKPRGLVRGSIAVAGLALVLPAAMGVVSLLQPDVLAELRTIASPQAASAGPCDWETEYNRGKAGQPGEWSVQASPYGVGGVTQLETGVVHIDPSTLCADLFSVIMHEAQHVKQGIIYGGSAAAESALAPYGGIEINADCAARYLMGSRYFPVGGDSSPYTSGPCVGEQLRAGVATATGQRV